MKIYLITTGSIILLGIIGFFWMQFYETKNDCIIKFQFNFYYMNKNIVSCKPNNILNSFFFFYKPLILLYPENTIKIDVNLGFSGWYSATFPEYDWTRRGWSVTATPESIVTDSRTGMNTYGLFWEWDMNEQAQFDLSKGFVVEWKNVREFLYEKLQILWLSTKEYSDFIMYWYPKLQGYPYIQITFAGRDYTDIAPLTITPKPESILRVFMVAKPLQKYQQIPEQKLEKFERKGFTVIEWWGTILE